MYNSLAILLLPRRRLVPRRQVDTRLGEVGGGYDHTGPYDI